LQSVGQVNGQSVLSIVAKLLWAGLLMLAIYLKQGLWAFAAAVTVTEGVKAIVLFVMARRHLHFSMRVRLRPTWLVLAASMPFFVSGLASTIYSRIGVSILSFTSNDREVGWFAAASGLQGMTLLLVPIISWVLTPLFARAAAASEGELYSVLRSSFTLILTGAMPLSLIMLVGADYWVTIAFGKAYAPAAASLQVLAVATPLMYTSMLAAYALAALRLSWRMGLVFVAGIVVSPLANLLLIPPVTAWLGQGGSGAACSIAVVVTECAIAIPLSIMLGSRCFNRELNLKLLKSTLTAAGVVALDVFVLRRFGAIRLLIDVVLYVGIAAATGALDFPGMIRWVKAARSGARDSAPHSAPPP
jgi:O-antigen/teichoic acid export membrane protein